MKIASGRKRMNDSKFTWKSLSNKEFKQRKPRPLLLLSAGKQLNDFGSKLRRLLVALPRKKNN